MARRSFNALLVELRHRFSNGFEVTAQYRLSESLDDGSNNFATDHYQYDPARVVWAVRLRRRRTRSRCSACGRRPIFKDSRLVGRETAGGWTHQRHPERAFRLPVDARLQQHRLRRRLRRERLERRRLELRFAAGGVPRRRGQRLQYRCVQEAGRQFPQGGAGLLHRASSTRRGPPFARRRVGSECLPGPIPQAPGVGRNAFRGPRYFNVDATVNKAFGLPTILRWATPRNSRSAPISTTCSTRST